MTQDSGYDLTPQDKPAVPPAPAPAAAADGPAAMPPAAPLPPGFVPPVPVILGPNDRDPDEVDAEEHRVVAILGYLVFMLPLVFAPKSKFARFHANQALLVFLCGAALLLAAMALKVVNYIVGTHLTFVADILGIVSCLAYAILVIFGIGVAALALMGIINASNGEKKELPVVGKVTLIK